MRVGFTLRISFRARSPSWGMNLKDQHVGNINDYRKYALLRALSAGGANQLGICWMLTESDDGSHDNQFDYLEQRERYRHYDPDLFDTLAHIAEKPKRRNVNSIKTSCVLPDALFHSDPLPQTPDERAHYMSQCQTQFAATDIVFFDPDNGIKIRSGSMSPKSTRRYIFLDEIAAFYAGGKSALICQHFPIRQHPRPFVAARVAHLRSIAPGTDMWVFTTAQVAFLLVIHPDSPGNLALAATEACSRWHHSFIRGERINTASPFGD